MPAALIYDSEIYCQGVQQSLLNLGQKVAGSKASLDIIIYMQLILIVFNLYGYIHLLANLVIAYQTLWYLKFKYFEWYFKMAEFFKRHKVQKKQKKNLQKFFKFNYLQDYHWDKMLLNLLGDSMLKLIEIEKSRKFMGKQPIYKLLNDETARVLGSLIEDEAYFEKEIVFNAGKNAESMYYLSSGRAAALAPDGTIVAEFGSGDYFGEISLISKESIRRFRVVTFDVCYFWILTKYNFNYVLQTNQAPLPPVNEYFKWRKDITTSAKDV